MVLCAVAALMAAWLALAADQALRMAVGRLAGAPPSSLALAPERGWTLVLVPGAGDSGPWVGAGMVAAGTAGMVAAALLLAGLVARFRAPGWLRAFALELYVVALLWTPTALAGAVAPGGRGPAAELYAGLGEPPAGRWAALGLALVLLVLAAGPIGRRTLSVARAWIRVDGPAFRRRAVRVTAGWPAVAALAGLGLVAGWAPSPLLALWLAAVLAALTWRIE